MSDDRLIDRRFIERAEDIGRRWGDAEADFWLAVGALEVLECELLELADRVDRAKSMRDLAFLRVDEAARMFGALVRERDEHDHAVARAERDAIAGCQR